MNKHSAKHSTLYGTHPLFCGTHVCSTRSRLGTSSNVEAGKFKPFAVSCILVYLSTLGCVAIGLDQILNPETAAEDFREKKTISHILIWAQEGQAAFNRHGCAIFKGESSTCFVVCLDCNSIMSDENLFCGMLRSEWVFFPPLCGGVGVGWCGAASRTKIFRNQNQRFQSKFAYCKLFGVYAGVILAYWKSLAQNHFVFRSRFLWHVFGRRCIGGSPGWQP